MIALQRDYSGVATKDLADLLRRFTDDPEVWAENEGISKRKIRRILSCDYQFTGLGIADEICTTLGLNVSQELTVIPASKREAAALMVADESMALAEVRGLTPLTQVEIEERIRELEGLRFELLGDPSPGQIDRLARDGQRTKERLGRERRQKLSLAVSSA